MPEGNDPDPFGRLWLAVAILAVAGILTVGVALAAATFAVALVVVRAATSGILRKL